MFKKTIRQFSPFIFRFCKFSSSKAIEQSKKINPKCLFCKLLNKENLVSLNVKSQIKY